MVRTQIYLTPEAHDKLRSLSQGTGRNQSELIREALDDFLVHSSSIQAGFPLNRRPGQMKPKSSKPSNTEAGRKLKPASLAVLRKCRGMWSGRDASEFEAARAEVERRLDR